jgi:hypothetical protein
LRFLMVSSKQFPAPLALAAGSVLTMSPVPVNSSNPVVVAIVPVEDTETALHIPA